MRKIKEFFWLCSGSYKAHLDECPSEASKYAGIGATVLFTGLFAALAGFYALYTVFDNYWIASVLGLIWGTMIFNLDRYIVSSMRKTNNNLRDFTLAIPRIILAILIALVISKPLELKIFEKEVDSEIVIMEEEYRQQHQTLIRSRYHPLIDSAQAEIGLLKSEIANKARQRDELVRIAQQEADGTGGSLRRNAGPIYRIKKADADRLDMELASLTQSNEELITLKTQQVIGAENAMKTEIQESYEPNLNGLASRLEALNRITGSNPAIAFANWFIILLFIAVETAPVFVKLISPKGPYDDLQLASEHVYRSESIRLLAKTSAATKYRSRKLAQKEREFVNDRLDVELDRI